MPRNGSSKAPSERMRVKRLPDRGHYDRETVHTILDAGLICHVGYVIDGQPYVTPTGYWREGDRVYWHGSSASRMLRQQKEGIPVCFTVTLLDGIVFARSGFHHSMNYRAVMALGTAQLVEGDDGEARDARGLLRAHRPRPLARDPAADRAGAEGHDDPPHGARRGLGETPHWRSGRRRGGLRPAVLGRRAADQPHHRCAASRR